MNATTVTRWLGATLGLVAVVWLDHRFGHVVASGVMLVVLIAVSVWGGHGRPRP